MSDEARATERPATFREVFASREFRAVFAALAISWFGDYLARAAVTALVYQRTQSVAMSAATFALSFLPWLVGGPLLATLVDRYSYRTVMIICDLVRMVTIGLVAVPGMPVNGMLFLLFITALANPPAQAAKSALMPLMLSRDRLVVGLALSSSSGQAAQVVGYMAGAAMAPYFPEVALLIDAATFGVSALLIRVGVMPRPPAKPEAARRHLLRETGEGFSLVFGTPVLRAIAIMVFASMLFSTVPEGLAAAWANDVSANQAEAGLSQAIIMAANPVGFILGGLLISRLVSPPRRQALVRPFAVLAPASLAPALLHPPAIGVAAMAAVCGFAIAGMMPTANGLFVQALPHGYRARAFGVMQSGVQLLQGAGVLGAGLLADVFALPDVVGVWSLAGILLMLVVSAWWPSPARFSQAIAAASRGAPGEAGGGARGLGQVNPVEPGGPLGAGALEQVRSVDNAGSPYPFPANERDLDQSGHGRPHGAGSHAGRHNSASSHHAPPWRGVGAGLRDETAIGGSLCNAGPHPGDDLPVRPTSPATGAGTGPPS